MKPAISQVCTLESPFQSDIEDYAAGHCGFVEIWLTKLEQYLERHSVDVARRLFEQHAIRPIAASFQGGLLISQGESRRAAWELFERRLALCQQLEIPVLVVAGDLVGPLQPTDLERARVSLTAAADKAAAARVRLALEFQAGATFGNNLQTAAALVDQIGHHALGLCLDAFHYYVGPSKPEDLELLTPANLFHVQLCDLLEIPRELASDSDRILPGDGDIRLAPILEHLRRIGYDQGVAVELMNPQLWMVPARQFGEIAITALRKLLGVNAT